MTELVAVVDVRLAMIVEVPAGTFDAVMKALALNLLELLRGCIPSAWALSVSIGRWAWRRTVLLRHQQT